MKEDMADYYNFTPTRKMAIVIKEMILTIDGKEVELDEKMPIPELKKISIKNAEAFQITGKSIHAIYSPKRNAVRVSPKLYEVLVKIANQNEEKDE